MNKVEKYRILAEIFLKRLVIPKHQLDRQEETFEKCNENCSIKILLDIGDIIPINELISISQTDNFEIDKYITNLIENENNKLQENIKNFLEMYVNNEFNIKEVEL